MSCERCCIHMTPVSASDFLDESGYIGFTAWQCPSCGARMEEIESCPTSTESESRRICYPVAG